jgi:hypothetical protein
MSWRGLPSPSHAQAILHCLQANPVAFDTVGDATGKIMIEIGLLFSQCPLSPANELRGVPTWPDN